MKPEKICSDCNTKVKFRKMPNKEVYRGECDCKFHLIGRITKGYKG